MSATFDKNNLRSLINCGVPSSMKKDEVSRFVVINVHIGYESNSLADFTHTHRAYCELYGYEYLQVSKNLLKGVMPTWSKHVAAIQIIESCDGILIIDSDAEILADCPPFHRLLETNRSFDLFLAFGNSYRPNAGVIILRGKALTSLKFLGDLLSEREKPIPPEDQVIAGGDNGHVINLLRRREFKEKLFLLSAVWNNTTEPTDWDFIRHYTGPMKAIGLAKARERLEAVSKISG